MIEGARYPKLYQGVDDLLGFSGTLLIVRPGFEAVDLGTLLVLASALIWSMALLTIKSLARTEAAGTMVVYNLLVM